MGADVLIPGRDGSAENSRPVDEINGVGVSLESSSACLCLWTGDAASGSATSVIPPGPAIPPAALLPRLRGEPTRGDLFWPPHPRGTGESWPPEARVSSAAGSGRFPLAYACPVLVSGDDQDRSNRWRWSAGDGTPVTAADAIAAAFEPLVAFVKTRATPHTPPVLVVPDGLHETAQRALIEAITRKGVAVRLLWRPVAAAMVWCTRFAAEMASGARQEGPLGSLLSLHLSLDSYEATILEVVARRHRGEFYLQPARRRPSDSGEHPSPWFPLMHRLAFEVLHPHATDERVWNLLWASPWIATVLSDNRGPGEIYDWPLGPEWDRRRVEPALARVAALVSSESRHLPGTFALWPLNTVGPAEAERWFRGLKSQLSQVPLLGAVVTGLLAAHRSPGGREYGHERLTSLGVLGSRTLIEGVDSPNILAHGSALYASRLAEGLPTYLDTLPRLQTVVQRRGVPAWEPLLEQNDRYVEGGRVWRREPNLDGFAIRKGGSELSTALDHGDYETVRDITTPLGTTCTAKQPVSLSVSIDPGQGGARIEILPVDKSMFGRRRVFVEWQRMADTGKTPEQYLERFPRAFPVTSERRSSLVRWQAARPVVELYLSKAKAGILDNPPLVSVVDILKKKDVSQMPQDATAVASDGTTPDASGLLARFVERAASLLAAHQRRGSQSSDKLVRALGYTSTDDPRLLDYLMGRIENFGADLPDYDLVASGNCLRSPAAIERFARAFTARMRRSTVGTNDWLKALAAILRYRSEATKQISSPVCMEVTRYALEVFKSELESANANYRFRNACLIIVYLLRRRAFDEGYLDPDCELAKEAKDAFRTAIRQQERGKLQLIGGSVDLKAALAMMVDYIDRRGSGKILLGV